MFQGNDNPMFSNLNSTVGDSMFGMLGAPDSQKGLPDGAAIKAASAAASMDDVRAEFGSVNAEVYDLTDEEDMARYRLDREHITVGTNMSTHMMLDYERQFVKTPDGVKVIVYMEWAVLGIKEQPVKPIGKAEDQ